MPSPIVTNDLKRLAESWRQTANNIHNKYFATNPNLVRHCEALLITHAEEIEEIIDRLERSGTT